MANSAVKKTNPFDDLVSSRSSDVQKGWRNIVNNVRDSGKMVIRNHQIVEAVILSPETYKNMQEELERARESKSNTLEELSRRFDQNLSSLKSPDTAKRVDSLFASTTIMGSKRPKAGKSF